MKKGMGPSGGGHGERVRGQKMEGKRGKRQGSRQDEELLGSWPFCTLNCPLNNPLSPQIVPLPSNCHLCAHIRPPRSLPCGPDQPKNGRDIVGRVPPPC